jgi:hypothetical protein
LALSTAACSNTTGGALFHIPFQAGGVDRDVTEPFTFTSPTGWVITLDAATRVALGPFYFNVAPPSPNTFRSGVDIAEVTQQVVVHPLDPTLHAATSGVDGETGQAVSAEVGLLPPDATASDDDATALGTGFAFVAGTAARGATTVSFAGNVSINAALVTPQSPLADLARVEGADVHLAFTSSSKSLVLRVDPTHWFDQVDFDTIARTSSVGGRVTWTVNSTFHTQLLQGVKSAGGVYDFAIQ